MDVIRASYLQLVLRGFGVEAGMHDCCNAWERLCLVEGMDRRNVLVALFDLGPAKAEAILDQLRPFLAPED